MRRVASKPAPFENQRDAAPCKFKFKGKIEVRTLRSAEGCGPECLGAVFFRAEN